MSGLLKNKDDEHETDSNSSRSSMMTSTLYVVESDIDRNLQVRYYLFVVYVYKHCLLILYL